MKKLNKNNKEGNNTFNLGGKEMNNNLGGIKMEAKRNRRRNRKGNDNLGGKEIMKNHVDMQWYRINDLIEERNEVPTTDVITYLVEGDVRGYLKYFGLTLRNLRVQDINPKCKFSEYRMWNIVGYCEEVRFLGVQFLVYTKNNKLVLELVKTVCAKRDSLDIERKINSHSRLTTAKSIKKFLRNTIKFIYKESIDNYTTAILTVSDLEDVCEDKVCVSSNYGIEKRLYTAQDYCIVRNIWKNSLSYNESFVCKFSNDVPHEGARKVFIVLDSFIKWYQKAYYQDCTFDYIFVENTDMGDYRIELYIIEKDVRIEIITNKESDNFIDGDFRILNDDNDDENKERKAFEESYKENKYGKKGALTTIKMSDVELVFMYNLDINYDIAKGILSSVIEDSHSEGEENINIICIYESSDGYQIKAINDKDKDDKKEYPYRYKKVDNKYTLMKEDWLTPLREEMNKLLYGDEDKDKEVPLNELQGKMEELIKDSESIIGKIDELEKLKNDLQFTLESHRNKIFEIQDDIEKIKNKGGK